MVKYLIVHLNGLLIDISKSYEGIVKLQWMALRQSNAKFSVSLEDYAKIEMRVRPLVVGNGKSFWLKFWKHVLVELGVHPVPSVINGLLEKFRVFFANSSVLYPDAIDFLKRAEILGFKIVLAESGGGELVDRVIDKFGLSDYFFKVVMVPDLVRGEPAFFDFVVEDLGFKDDDVCVLCSRVDKDWGAAGLFNRVLVTRKFFERVNKCVQGVPARNLLQVFDLINKSSDSSSNNFYSNFVDELNS
ncbi:MAG: HAD family hydrolase [Nanoarchaeota archaeon]|nr:HAD family hydrolase [Nanoarchaeota archaeon]